MVYRNRIDLADKVILPHCRDRLLFSVRFKLTIVTQYHIINNDIVTCSFKWLRSW